MFVDRHSSWLAGDAQQERLDVPVVGSLRLVVADGEQEGHELGEDSDRLLPPIAAAVGARHLCCDCNGYCAALSTVPQRGDESGKTNPLG